nr:hypothetical protein CFP56_72536 [Quercus suber]
MARPSKAHTFAIWEDRDAATQKTTKDKATSGTVQRKEQGNPDGPQDAIERAGPLDDNVFASEHIDRRESEQSRVSTLPESTVCDDHEVIMQRIYQGRPIIRPSFMRPETVRRLRMTSPPPFQRAECTTSSSRDSSHVRCDNGRSHQRSVSSHSASTSASELDVLRYPLVLLHITVLPLDLRWDLEVMRETLSPETFNNLMLLRSKMTDMVLQRGILVPHPGEGYDLLEERLLEALELRSERVSADGHFRPQHQSRDSTTSIATSSLTSDSGIGSSVQSVSEAFGATTTQCETCQREIDVDENWHIKVYAANGLMRAAAWSAAWSEMERVDVEISPRISEDLEKELTRKQEAVEKSRREAVEIYEQNLIVPPQWPRRDVSKVDWSNQITSCGPAVPVPNLDEQDNYTSPLRQPGSSPESQFTRSANDVPQIFKPAQIPLALLVKNYIVLLLKKQDWKNITIVFLVFSTLLLALRPATVVSPMANDLTLLDPLVPQSISGMASSRPEYGVATASTAADTSTMSSVDLAGEFKMDPEHTSDRLAGKSASELNPSAIDEFGEPMGAKPSLAGQSTKGSGFGSPVLLPQTRIEHFQSTCPWSFPFSAPS